MSYSLGIQKNLVKVAERSEEDHTCKIKERAQRLERAIKNKKRDADGPTGEFLVVYEKKEQNKTNEMNRNNRVNEKKQANETNEMNGMNRMNGKKQRKKENE